MDKQTATVHVESTMKQAGQLKSGQEVPGIKKLNITACNQEPTASQITRRRKPWEADCIQMPCACSPCVFVHNHQHRPQSQYHIHHQQQGQPLPQANYDSFYLRSADF
uniref:Peroxisomal membrane protein PEX14-like KPWE domain-containing protein n=1 Tax=Erpetoichthys calabaricus TaxID=27687 RepID=A0A8C4SB10_ERPCA